MQISIPVIISCEHAGNIIPRKYRQLFSGHQKLIQSHRSHDPGALHMARIIAKGCAASLHASKVSRLLVDLNRSPAHAKIFSRFTDDLPHTEKEEILKKYYFPYRNAVESAVSDSISHGMPVLHLSVHTFTPVLHGKRRKADIGILYDPERNREREFSARWQKTAASLLPDSIIRRNYPYQGKTDGFTTFLRKRFRADQYLGIELEVNQWHIQGLQLSWNNLAGLLARSLVAALII